MTRSPLLLLRDTIRSGDTEGTLAMIASDASLAVTQTPLGTALHYAAEIGNLGILRALLELGVDINIPGPRTGAAPLDYAASAGQLDAVKMLLDAGARIDTKEPDRNPLFSAIQGGHSEVARLLIDAGIDTTVKYTGENMTNMDALAFAREWGRTDIAELILAHQAKGG